MTRRPGPWAVLPANPRTFTRAWLTQAWRRLRCPHRPCTHCPKDTT